MSNVRIFLADDHAILREGLKFIITSIDGYEIIGESGDGKQALEMIEKLKPDVAIIDITMPTMTGIDISRHLKKYNSGVKIIILSRHSNDEYVNILLKYGIRGYVLKDNAGDDLLRAIAEVLQGNIYLSPRITKSVISGHVAQDNADSSDGKTVRFSVLSGREQEILKLIAEGKSNVEIASLLWISEKTVKVHRANIMKKLNIHKVTDIVKYALKSGIIEP